MNKKSLVELVHEGHERPVYDYDGLVSVTAADRANHMAALFVKEVLLIPDFDPLRLPATVGLTGNIGSGKTAASWALGSLGYRSVSFAAPLKAVAFQIFGPLGMPREAFYGTQAEKSLVSPALGVSGRRIMELVGTEGFRAAYPDVWCRHGLVRRYPGERLVVDDVRYENEATIIRSEGILVFVSDLLETEYERSGHASDAGVVPRDKDYAISAARGDVAALKNDLIKVVLLASR
jgi:hypothetical protein